MTEEYRLFIPKPVKLETITNSKEINSNIDKIQNPFQNLRKAREDLYQKKLDWIKNLLGGENVRERSRRKNNRAIWYFW